MATALPWRRSSSSDHLTEALFDLGDEASGQEDKGPEAAQSGPLRRVMLLVAYDGGPFHGFAVQADPDLPTVGGSLAKALSKMLGGKDLSLTCAGRTDAGVHARGQVVHTDLPAEVVERWLSQEPRERRGELPRLAKSLTNQCGPAIAVWRARVAKEGFDARHSALARRYRYLIRRGPAPDPLWRERAWQVSGDLDLPAMRLAADTVLGEHDFAAFCRRPPGREGPITRRVSEVAFSQQGELLSFDIEANAFCHQMVRSIVGCLVAVGRGKMTPARLFEVLGSPERANLADPAPPAGLSLEIVRYPSELVEGGVFSVV
jgi:tRNA pseudouridine38-40 synthase